MVITNKCNERKIAVLTGGGGYIGKNLNSYLIANGWDTVLLVRLGTETSFRSPFVENHCQILVYDGTQDSLATLQFHPSANVVFFHLAAHSGVDGLSNNTGRFIDSNIIFGMHLLEFMAKNGYQNFVFAESYWQFDSEGKLGGKCLYATTKSAFSMLAEYFSKYVCINALVLYDVYGPCDARGKLVNVLLNSVVTKTPIDLTPGEQLLDYVHIDDVVRAFELVGRSLLSRRYEEKIFCRSTVRTMEVRKLKEFVEILGQVVGNIPNVRWGEKPYPAHQIMMPWFPSEKFQLNGWQPKYTFLTGLKSLLKYESNKTNNLYSKF